MDFVWTVNQSLRSDSRIPSCKWRIVAIPQSAVQLKRGVNDLMDHICEEHLCDTVFVTQVHTLFGFVGYVH